MKYGYEAVRSFTLPVTVGKQEHRKTYPPKMHFHNSYELMYVTSGKYQVYGPQLLYEGEGACMMFFNRGVYHCMVRMDCEAVPFCGYDLYFLQSVIDGSPSQFLNVGPLLENSVTIIPIDRYEYQFFTPKLDEMRSFYVQTRDSGVNPPVLTCMALTILNRLSDLVREEHALHFRIEGDTDFYIADVAKYIIEEIDCGRDVSVAEIAEHFYVSTTKLSNDFHRKLGIPIKRMLCELRLQRAKAMLKSGKDVKETAQGCGFTSDSYFVQFFKKYTGMSPGRYRDQERGISPDRGSLAPDS